MTSTLFVGKARIDVAVESNGIGLPMERVLDWVGAAAGAVRGYYGIFPVPHVSVSITPFRGSGVRGGMTFAAERGGRIVIRVGDKTSEADFESDWVLTHEMVHLSFPSVADKHHWIEEGIATYVEPIARVRAGYLTPEKMWEEVARDMPQGLPERGDRGLDRTHTWGRTYWGGAIFCLLADIEIRRQTKDKKGLEDALRAVLQAGGDIRKTWALPEALKVGDRATGTRVLQNLYEEMKDSPVQVNLDAIWADLGVRIGEEGVHFDDGARLAAIRRSITSSSQSVSRKDLADETPVRLAGRVARDPFRKGLGGECLQRAQPRELRESLFQSELCHLWRDRERCATVHFAVWGVLGGGDRRPHLAGNGRSHLLTIPT